MILQEFNKIYRYKSDKDKFNLTEVWEIPSLSEDGYIYADCESYCRFLKEHIEKFEEWDYYYCKLNGIGHCVLSNGAMIIDCNVKTPVLKDKYFEMYNITDYKKYSLFTVFIKILFSKLFN